MQSQFLWPSDIQTAQCSRINGAINRNGNFISQDFFHFAILIHKWPFKYYVSMFLTFFKPTHLISRRQQTSAFSYSHLKHDVSISHIQGTHEFFENFLTLEYGEINRNYFTDLGRGQSVSYLNWFWLNVPPNGFFFTFADWCIFTFVICNKWNGLCHKTKQRKCSTYV